MTTPISAFASSPLPRLEPRRGGQDASCPCCAGTDVRVFYELDGVPVNSVLQLATREQALNLPRGDLKLALCGDCEFIFNLAFEPDRTEYSDRYSPTQAFSPTFGRWHVELVERLVSEQHLSGRRVLEIGCGKGEFLKHLCERGNSWGVGYDPAYDPVEGVTSERVRYVPDFYGEHSTDETFDFVCCRMTLEHLPAPHELVSALTRSACRQAGVQTHFQVPDTLRILEEAAFWDIYYEHCGYFCEGSLRQLFEKCGFSVTSVRREFDGQYLMLDAVSSGRTAGVNAAGAGARGPVKTAMRELAAEFAQRARSAQQTWHKRLSAWHEAGKRVVLWGSGSKGVAFLSTLGQTARTEAERLALEAIELVVDINPHRSGHFMAGTGQLIVAPERLVQYRPDVVLVMNPVYQAEIEKQLEDLGVRCEVLAL